MDRAGWMERFRDHLAAQGLKVTRQRRVIADVFFEQGGHLSLGQLLDLAL